MWTASRCLSDSANIALRAFLALGYHPCTPVGVQGNTGYSFGEHCHFEVRKNNVSINPAPLLGIENKIGTYKDKQNNSEFAIND